MDTPEQVTQAIVVLGYRLNTNGTLTRGLQHRLDTAAELYRRGVAPVIITSGWYAFDYPELRQFCEAELMGRYLHAAYGNDLRVMYESDSVNMPENLLFTRVKFPNIEHLTIVAGEHSAERARFFAEMFFAGRAQIACHACADGIGNPERELRLLGDAKCTLQEMTAGDLSFLLRPPSPEGRLQSRWNELRFAHHDCPYWGELHP